MHVSKPIEYWKDHVINQFLDSLYIICVSDRDPLFRNGAAGCIKELLLVSVGRHDQSFIPPDGKPITCGEISEMAEKCKDMEQKTFLSDIELFKRIREWGNASSETSHTP